MLCKVEKGVVTGRFYQLAYTATATALEGVSGFVVPDEYGLQKARAVANGHGSVMATG